MRRVFGTAQGKRLVRIRVSGPAAPGPASAGPSCCSWWSHRWCPPATCAACTTAPQHGRHQDV